VSQITAQQLAYELLHVLANWPPGILSNHPGVRSAGAAKLLNVSQNTLRSWEQRYGFPTTTREDENSNRYYNAAQLLLLRRALHFCDGDINAALAVLKVEIESRR
jgi:transposase-like protein